MVYVSNVCKGVRRVVSYKYIHKHIREVLKHTCGIIYTCGTSLCAP